jgi:hypothetical protein
MNISDLESLTKNELVTLARKYTVYYITKSGQGSTSNYDSLTKTELINLLRNDRDYLKAVGKLRRIDVLKQKLLKTSKRPEDIMNVILDVFSDTSTYPSVGNYFTYRYYAKTPRLLYDQHPLMACLGVYEWGFRGLNFHLNLERNYTWPEVASGILLVQQDEIEYMKTITYRKLVQNP